MNPVSNTAYYCCGVRMEDAGKADSICGDIYAERFMDEDGLKIFEPFRSEVRANRSNVSRCRLIDDYLRDELRSNSEVSIVTVGAGFDSRPYRLAGGNWIEIDEAAIIEVKNEKLPIAECPNPLARVSIDFAGESLVDKLAAIDPAKPTLFVIEGVFMYLEPRALEETVDAIQSACPGHRLYCDLMTRRFFERFAQGVHAKLVDAGGRFSARPENPEADFTRRGYRLLERRPMFRHCVELGIAGMPKAIGWLALNLFLRDLGGYAVCRFDHDAR